MVQTRAQSKKTRQGLAGGLAQIKGDAEPFSVPALPSDRVAPANRRAQRTQLKGQRKMRTRRLIQKILGHNRVFSGTVCIPHGRAARQDDKARLNDIAAAMALGHATAYWADGLYGGSGAKKGFMGAGVVWLEGSQYHAQSFELGHNSGYHEDAELFAIAAALGRAKKAVEKRKEICLVRVYSDASEVLKAIDGGQHQCFGPMITPRTALQGLYERAEWLIAHRVAVELVWVKGHSMSYGNACADKAAAEAVSQQALLSEQEQHGRAPVEAKLLTDADVPDQWTDLGPDWAEEWLFRANQASLRGNGTNEDLDSHEDPPSSVAEEHASDGYIAFDDDPFPQTNSASSKSPDLKPSSWHWGQYGYTLPEHGLPIRTDVPKAVSRLCDSHHNGLILPEHDLYGNTTAREAMADLRKKFESVSKDITNMERYMAREAPKKSITPLRANLRELDVKRDRIAAEFQAQTERLLVQEGDMPLIKIEEP